MNYLQKSTVIIIGGTSGLGFSLAQKISTMVGKVIIAGRNHNNTDQKLPENLQTEDLDLLDLNSISNFVTKMKNYEYPGQVILLCNAGIWLEGEPDEPTNLQIANMIQTNLTGHMQVVTELLGTIVQQTGHILFTNSVAGIDITTGYIHYCASKFGLKGFATMLEYEMKDKNVKVSSIYPGGMDTPLFEKAGFEYGKADWMMNHEDVADAIIFMLNQPKNVVIDSLVIRNYPHNLSNI